jgi:diadenosine tetraphosphate (Ap4A) HIT family hydrolase
VSCFSCEQERKLDELPLRERIHVENRWRVSHAFNTKLPGWLVLVPRRHIERLDELTPEEAERLGPLLVELTRALRKVTGCVKTYVALYAEAEGFAHVHFHVVPRMSDQDPALRGPRITALLGVDDRDAVSADERERLAAAIAAELHWA